MVILIGVRYLIVDLTYIYLITNNIECLFKNFLIIYMSSLEKCLFRSSENFFDSVQFKSVAQSCLTLCDLMDYRMPGLPVQHLLPEFTQTHVHWVSGSSVILFCYRLQSFPASGSFPMTQFFASGAQCIGVSASTSVLPMNIQDWSPLGWTGWISLQYKGLSRVFSNTTVQKHQFFYAQHSL